MFVVRVGQGSMNRVVRTMYPVYAQACVTGALRDSARRNGMGGGFACRDEDACSPAREDDLDPRPGLREERDE